MKRENNCIYGVKSKVSICIYKMKSKFYSYILMVIIWLSLFFFFFSLVGASPMPKDYTIQTILDDVDEFDVDILPFVFDGVDIF